MKREEDIDFFNHLQNAAATGDGYGEDEFVSLDYFRSQYLLNNYNIVVENPTKVGDVIAMINFGPEVSLARCSEACLTDASVIILPCHRAKGYSSLASAVYLAMARSQGYTKVFLSSAATNSHTVRMMMEDDSTFIGCLPDNLHLAGWGLVDTLLSYKDITHIVQPSQNKKEIIESKL